MNDDRQVLSKSLLIRIGVFFFCWYERASISLHKTDVISPVLEHLCSLDDPR